VLWQEEERCTFNIIRVFSLHRAIFCTRLFDAAAGGCQPLQEGKGHHQGQRQAFVSG
jgi:hypothetical protein